ncbi:mitochondrial 54S ribosomal protein YmL32 [Saccharomycopsis crataegensis]|uniref:Large ribosomal subunit protein bL32m n=1 Tax=Saccharomycopsis crataegensis TaxID=43959 RepID=A0AAV5QJS8_9ASCO|nr:mitochondrial 54S ribosomal protein YmL32 [Saccharomycopsis crataegensis]
MSLSIELSHLAGLRSSAATNLLPRISSLLPRLPEISITLQGSPASSNAQENEISSQIDELKQRIQNSIEIGTQSALSLWDGILRAAPKKKVSHQKKRQRQLAPGKKQLQHLNNLNRCPSCGHYKRAHTLCMNCVGEIRKYWKQLDAAKNEQEVSKPDQEKEVMKVGDSEESVDSVDQRILYPGKRKFLNELKHVEKEEYLERRPKTLPVEK